MDGKIVNKTEMYREAFCEVDEIIKNMPEEVNKKISEKFKKFIELNKSENYKPNINKNKPLKEQNLRRESLIILSLIYRSFICSEDEKKRLLEEDKRKLEEHQKEIKEKYDPNNIFKKKTESYKETEMNSNLLMIEKENIIKRLITKILRIFSKK